MVCTWAQWCAHGKAQWCARLNGFYSGMTRCFVCWHGSMVCILAWLNGLYVVMAQWFVCWYDSMVCMLAWLNVLYGGKVQ